MPSFQVRFVQDARVVVQRVQAQHAQAIAAQLGVGAASILAVEPVADAAVVAASGPRPRRVVRFPLRLFSKELAVLLGAGIPLLEAVQTLREKEQQPAVAAALDTVVERLQAGEPLSAALAARPEAFDSLFTAVVGSAERTGQLRDALAAHAAYLAWTESLRDKLIGAAIYPLLLIVAGVAVLVFLLLFVVPRFAGLIGEAGHAGGSELPAASRLLLEIGGWTGAHPLACIALAVALLLVPVLAWQQPALREAVALATWRLPALGDKLRLLALARLYRTLSMLLAAGVPMVPAMKAVRPVTALRLQAALDAATDAVSRGERLSDALVRQQLGTPVSVRMVRVGERSGSVGPMLAEAAAFYDEELVRLTELVTRLVNPLLMVVMGGLIGAVVVLMYLPIFQLMEQVQ